MTTSTKTCAVTIAGPDRRVDLVVSTETPVAELMPTFLEMSMDEPPEPGMPQAVWSVALPGRSPLPLDRTLRDAGVSDGDVLTLSELRPQTQSPPRPAELRKPRARHGPPVGADAVGAATAAGPRQPLVARDPGVLRPRAGAAVIESAAPPMKSPQERLSRPEQRGPAPAPASHGARASTSAVSTARSRHRS
jgi:hypothetical protein